MIRDEIMYGILVVALVLFAFWIMPRYEHMSNASTIAADLANVPANEEGIKHSALAALNAIQVYHLPLPQSDATYLTQTLATLQKGKKMTSAEIRDATKRLASIGKKLDEEIKLNETGGPTAGSQTSPKTPSTSSIDAQLQSLLKDMITLTALNDKEQIISAADMNSITVIIQALIGTGASQAHVDDIKKTVDGYKSLLEKHAGKTHSSSSKSSLSSLNLTLPGPSDEYEPGPMGVDTKDKYVLKSSLVPTCTTCTGGGRNMFPTSVVPGDQDGCYATMLPNQYNLMNPDAMLGEEEPKPFLTSFASFMK